MKLKLATLLLLAGSSLFAKTHISFGIGIGGPVYTPAPVVVYAPPPVVYRTYYAPPAPGPGLVWVSGYWYPVRHSYRWRTGYWTRPPFAHARWVAPRYHGRHYYPGHWRR